MRQYLAPGFLWQEWRTKAFVARGVLAVLALLLISGCAKTTVTDRQGYQGPALPRPARILVYDFAASAADLPPGYSHQTGAPTVDQTPDDLALGRKLGAEIAKNLVSELQAAGLPAVQAGNQPPPQLNDITIVGYFVSVDPGNLAKRVAIGFGSGAPELKTVVEGYQMTDKGLRRLGQGELNSAGPKGPGEVVPLALTLATANPIGLIVSSAAKIEGETTGRTTIEGTAKRTAKEIGDQLKAAAQRQGWI
jgi:hypothetical protein